MTQNNRSSDSSRGCFSTLFKLLIFVLLLSILAALIVIGTGLYTSSKILDPVTDFVREIGIPATPVIRPDTITLVNEINDLARLETASYTMEKIVTAEQGSDVLWGLFEDELVFVAVGEVIAGVDLAKLTEGDMVASTFQTVTIRLPEAEIFVATLDNDKSYIADRDTGVLARNNPTLETEVRQTAEKAILDSALGEGILELADKNAQDVLSQFLLAVGFETIVFVTGEMEMPIAPVIDDELPKGFLMTREPES